MWSGVVTKPKEKSEQSDFLTKLYPFFTSTNSFCYFEKVRLGRHTRLISATFSLGIFWFLPSQLESLTRGASRGSSFTFSNNVCGRSDR